MWGKTLNIVLPYIFYKQITVSDMKFNPLKQTERITIIDSLRGFALLGILMVNLPFMYEPMSTMALGANAGASEINKIAGSFIRFFFEGKFYVIFSLLFGFGFSIFMNKGTGAGSSVLPVFMRRLFFLFLFGAAHMVLLWAGDVLMFYAFYGFILILFRKRSDKTLFRWAAVFALLPSFIILSVLVVALLAVNPELKLTIESLMNNDLIRMTNLVDKASQIYSTGSFAEIVSVRIEEYLNSPLFYSSTTILAMFIIGFLLARKGILTNLMDNKTRFQKIFRWGLVLGVITNMLYLISYSYSSANEINGWLMLMVFAQSIGGIALGLCYVSGIALLFIKGKSGYFTKYFAPVGRMALTNYLFHSIIAAILFHSYGFALLGKVETWQGVVLTFFIFAVQIVFSRWWLNHFQFGPFEWVWRSLTYFKVQPIRKSN
jgi:uncharacterized protein